MLKMYRHGQYEGSKMRGMFGTSNKKRVGSKWEDDHHSPLTADGYLKLRV